MRVLFASTQGAGHFNPLVTFIDAALRQGHEVLVTGPSVLTPTVEKMGYPFLREILGYVNLGPIVDAMPVNGAAALMCVEADPEACHRLLVAERLEAEFGLPVEHLRPPPL